MSVQDQLQAMGVLPAPANISMLLHMAFFADNMRHYDEAYANYAAVLEQNPNHLFALTRLLTIDGVQGRLDAAEIHHKQLIKSLETADLKSVHWMQLGAIAYQSVIRALPRDIYVSVMREIDRQLIALTGGPKFKHENKARKHRLRVGYLSSCLRDHPIGHVTADLFASHNRERVEVVVFYSPEGPDTAITDRARTDAEKFVELSGHPTDIAATIAAHEVDVLIYLDNIMSLALLPVLTMRPAPVQISWLGVAGNCDLSCIDYFIADETVVPRGEEDLYFAPVLRLPGTYHCAFTHAVGTIMSRAEAGLPDSGFVFCAFNNPEKIDRTVFQSWMRILSRVDGSVLWLSRTHSRAIQRHLGAVAQDCGISPNRLIIADRIEDKADHLARHKLAGLFLDTMIHNASTMALDALWVGLPVLTIRGARFSACIATSLLQEIGMNRLICDSLQEFEDKAVYLATHEADLEEIRGKLNQNKETTPLFNTQAFCEKLEDCLLQVPFRRVD